VTLTIALARLIGLVALGVIGGMLMLARRAGIAPRNQWLFTAVAIAFLATAAQVLLQASLAGGENGLSPSLLATFITQTWGGKVALMRLGLIIVLAAVLAGARASRGHGAALLLVIAALIAAPFGGHAATAMPSEASFALHGLHAVAASLWIGGLLVLAMLAIGEGAENSFRPALAAFSPAALILVAIAIAAGVGAAVLQIERPAALFGTRYGQILLVKAVLLLIPALMLAAWLRWRFLKAGASRATAMRILSIEAAFGLGVMALGSFLSQTIPGRHDAVDWPLPFRFAPEIAWQIEGGAQDILATLVGGAAAPLLAVILYFKGGAFRQTAAISAGVGIACFGLLAHIVSVTAYPTSFATTSVAYTADAIMQGRQVFLANCVVCHGESGHGDGPGAGLLPIAPADLAAPHTDDHTAGDMYWWMTNGMPSGAMPGVGDAITEDEKWALITYIRALSSGYAGRYVPKRVIPRLPWLGAIDFSYQTADGGLMTLNDWRERAVVLLILVRDAEAAPRLREILAMAGDLERARTQILVVSSEKLADAIGPLPANATLIETETATILDAWSLYRRTFWDMDPNDARPAPPYMEFLIDRFGYVRLRGRSDDETLSPPKVLGLQATYLAEEPQQRPPPGEHVH